MPESQSMAQCLRMTVLRSGASCWKMVLGRSTGAGERSALNLLGVLVTRSERRRRAGEARYSVTSSRQCPSSEVKERCDMRDMSFSMERTVLCISDLNGYANAIEMGAPLDLLSISPVHSTLVWKSRWLHKRGQFNAIIRMYEHVSMSLTQRGF